MRRMTLCYLAPLVLFLVFSSFESKDVENEAAIRQKTKFYEDAFNRKDAKALASLWAEDAEYIIPETGEVISGRDDIEKAFVSVFQEKKAAQMDLKINSITFPSSDEAVETGIARVKEEDGQINQTAYKALYEKQNGEWLLGQVREVGFINPPQQNEHLKDLDWLIGEWVDEDEDVTIVTVGKWDKYKNFLTQQFTVTTEGEFDLEGKQIIAWDPVNKKILSWVFDSDGGFGEGIWNKKNDSWVVETSNTLADGKRGSSINIYTPIDQNSYKWESINREVGGELLPNIEPVIVVRKKDEVK